MNTQVKQDGTIKYNNAKPWQIGLFAMNNAATNMYMFLMMYVSFYATGIVGLGVVLIGTILTSMRIFDGITDPIIGYWIDKTNTKFGKFRPFMFLGNAILAVTSIVIFYTSHLLPESLRLIYFILIYAIYIIGYTFQTACTKAGLACLTNNPKQRPTFSIYDSLYNAILLTGLGFIVSNVMVPKYGGFGNIALFHEILWLAVIVSGVLTFLAIVGIWQKDKTEFFGLGKKSVKVKFSDYVQVLKGNKAIQMLVVTAATDKLAGTVASNAVITVMLYGIVMGNYALSGSIAMITLVPTFLCTVLGIQYAKKYGQKKALVGSTWICIGIYIAMFLLLTLGNPMQISLNNFGFMTIGFMILLILSKGAVGVAGNIVIPMIADCSDYETSISGRYVPGMMGTLFSFVDKLISSLATTIVSIVVAMIGFTVVMPDITDKLTPAIFWATMFMFIGMPIFGWICSLVAMKFYPLTAEKMKEVQNKIDSIKNESIIEEKVASTN